MGKDNYQFKIRFIIGIIIILFIVLIHTFRIGSYLNGYLYSLYYSYASDIMLPFGLYFLLCINEQQIKILRKWYSKVVIIFLVATFCEVLQFFGVYFFGVTFDIFDILFYGLGAIFAAFVDKIVFSKFIQGWKYRQ